MKDKKPNFMKEIKQLMYAHGDTITPRLDTAEAIHEYACKYLIDVLHKAKNVSKSRGRTKTEDLLYTIKRDRRKYSRAKELLTTNEELKRARNPLDYDSIEKE